MRIPSVLFVVGLFLAACGPQSEGTDAPPASTPQPGGTLRLAEGGDPGNLDPLRMTNNHAARVLDLMHPGLFRRDADNAGWKPGLATEWSLSADSLALTVTLDTRLRWSDGKAFDASDVVASFDTYRDEAFGYPRRSRLRPLEAVEALDEARIRFRFAQRVLDPQMVLAHDILPAHVVETLDPEDLASSPLVRNPVTLGHYRLQSWDSDERLVLERNPHHPGPPGHVETIEVLILPDGPSRILRLKAGEVDVVGSIPMAQAEDLARDPELEVVEVTGRTTAFLQYNLRDPHLADVRVRRALSHAIDREGLVQRVYAGRAKVAASFLPPGSWAHDADLAPTPFDPDRARALLAEAGFEDQDGNGLVDRDGEDLTFRMLTISGDPTREAVATVLQTQLREAGVGVDLRPIEISSLMGAVRADDYQILFSHLGGPLDADVRVFLTSEGRFNLGHYEDPQFDRLAEVAATGPDRTTARAAALRMQARLQEQQPVSMLYYPATLIGLRARVQGATPNYLTPFADVAEWWLAE